MPAIKVPKEDWELLVLRLNGSTAGLQDLQKHIGGRGVMPKLDWQIGVNLDLLRRLGACRDVNQETCTREG